MRKFTSILATMLAIAPMTYATDYITCGDTKVDVDDIKTIKYTKGATGYESALITLNDNTTQTMTLSEESIIEFETPRITFAYLQWVDAEEGAMTTGKQLEAGAVVFADGVTNRDTPSTEANGIEAQIGCSFSSTDPTNEAWTWHNIPFAGDWGDNFYFQGKTAEAINEAGDCHYTIRFRIGEYDSWHYASKDDANYSTVTVNTPAEAANVTWATLGNWFTVWNDNGIQLFEATAEIFMEGITNNGSKPEGIQVQFGISKTNSDPKGDDWTWGGDCWAQWASGSNYVYQGRVELQEQGNYYYVVRARYGENSEWIYGGTNGVWNGTDSTGKPFAWE